MNNIKPYLISFFCFAALFCEANIKHCTVEVNISPAIDKSILNFYFYNGFKGSNIPPSTKTIITDSFCSIYAVLTISFKEDSIGSKYYTFYISDKSAKIYLEEILSGKNKKRLSYKAINAFSTEKINEELAIYTENEQRKYDLALSQRNLDSNYFSIYKELIDKKLSFIQKKCNNYYSLLLFSTLSHIRFPTEFRHLLNNLYPFYTKTFSYDFRNSIEGREIEDRLKNNLFVLEEGMKMPEFNARDFEGNYIDSRNFKEKYLLIDFWASWCGPCMAERPSLKKIRDEFPRNKLQIVSVSYDYDSTAFIKNINKYKLDWIHLFRNQEISDKFGISGGGLPQLLLVNKEGMVIYSRSSGKETNYEKLDYLNALLVSELGRQ